MMAHPATPNPSKKSSQSIRPPQSYLRNGRSYPRANSFAVKGDVLPAHSAPVATLIPPEPAHTRQRDAEETLLLESTLVLQIQVNLTFHTTINGLTVFNVLSQLIPD